MLDLNTSPVNKVLVCDKYDTRGVRRYLRVANTGEEYNINRKVSKIFALLHFSASMAI